MLPAILGDSVVPQGLFEQLRKETALVQDHSEMAGMQDGQAGSLRIRPEVRTATLQLLTAHDSRRVAHNHRLATKWYEQNAGDHPAGKAELIYHYLCSGQLGKAREIWQDAYAAYLKDAAQDIPAQHLDAREWLEKILKAQESPGHDLPGWEADALTRIQQSLGRHHFRAVAGILQERPDRTEESHLTVYDAWIAWLNDSERPDKALALLKLDGKLPIAGPAVTARYILAATILAKRGQNQFADSILDLLEQSSDIRYKQKWNATELLIRSARVRLHVSLVNELAIYKELVRPKTPAPDTVVQHILPMDVMTSPFIMKASFQPNRMNISILPIPDNQNELEIFRQNIFEISQRRYGRSLKTKDTQGHLSEIDMFSNWMTLMMPPAHHGNLSEKEIFSTLYSMLGKSIEDKYAVGSDNRLFVTVYDELIKAFASLENGAELAERITVLIATGVKKWDLVTHDLFLANVVNDVSSLGANPLIVRAIVFTLAAFRGQDLRFTGSQRYMSDDNNAIDTYIEQVARSTKGSDLYPAAEAVDLAKAVMLQSPKMPDSARRTISALTNNPDRRYLLRIFQDYAHGHKMNDDVNSVILYLLGPDPLDLLYRSALSLPLAADISIA